MSDFKLFRVIATLLGVFISWYTTVSSFIKFYQIEGTIFKIKDCVLPNPVSTPCFWGALAFLGALIWSFRLYMKENPNSEKKLLYFLIFSVVFAWSSFYIENWTDFLKNSGVVAPCPANSAGPFLSACFLGSVLFTTSLILTILSGRVHNKES